jgi:signal transduction histidine kinase/CheY-like chemotaxis protein
VTTPLRVLQIEDVEDDALLVAIELKKGGWEPICHRVETADDMRRALRQKSWDLVISDFGLPRFDAPSALAVLQEYDIDVPFIIVSGTIAEEVAVAAMKAGAHDYVTKLNLKRLVPAVQRELREAESRRERRRAEDERRRADDRFHTLVDSLDGIVFTLDRELRIDGMFGRGLTPTALDSRRYLGKTVGDLLGSGSPGAGGPPNASGSTNGASTGHTTPGEAEPPHDAACVRALAGEHVAYEWSQDLSSGMRHVQVSLSPIGRRDEVTGIVGIVRDISDQKKLQAHLLVTDRMASIGTLAAGVAHEINNPLASLMANLDLASREIVRLASGKSPTPQSLAELEEELGDAREATQRVSQIVRDLRLFSRASEDQRGAVDVRRILDSSIRMAWNEIRHRAKLVRDYQSVPRVIANDARLGQVFLNLLINAAQAIPEGNADGNEIRVATRTDGRDLVMVEITDTGAGIPEQVKARLFTPFFTTKPVGVGTGLGLSICHRIVTSLGGDITIESAEGHGATFRVTLPVAQATVTDEPTPTPEPARPFRRGRVLVVDDEAMIRRSIQRSLGSQHDVTSASSGREALDLLVSGERFDMIFCDLMMPEMTGMELHAVLQMTSPEQAKQMVFLTGGAFTESARRFLSEVPNVALDKPFDPQKLLTLVNERIG